VELVNDDVESDDGRSTKSSNASKEPMDADEPTNEEMVEASTNQGLLVDEVKKNSSEAVSKEHQELHLNSDGVEENPSESVTKEPGNEGLNSSQSEIDGGSGEEEDVAKEVEIGIDDYKMEKEGEVCHSSPSMEHAKLSPNGAETSGGEVEEVAGETEAENEVGQDKLSAKDTEDPKDEVASEMEVENEVEQDQLSAKDMETLEDEEDALGGEMEVEIVEQNQLSPKDAEAIGVGIFGESGRESEHYKDNVGMKNGLSMLEHLKLQAKVKVKVIRKEKISRNTDEEKVSEEVMITTGEEGKQEETESFTAKSYRVVIVLKRGARIQKRTDTLLCREVLDKARIVIFEFALTPKNMDPKKVFTSVLEGSLKDVAHGDIWPESGSLSFKRTLSKILTEMQMARSKARRASTVDAMFEENEKLKKKGEEFKANIKKMVDEADRLKKSIKKARGFLA